MMTSPGASVARNDVGDRPQVQRTSRDWYQSFSPRVSFGPIQQHFILKRHLLRASLYRNSSPHASPLGIVSLNSPKIRPVSEQLRAMLAIAPHAL
jgi:hypothetical protein